MAIGAGPGDGETTPSQAPGAKRLSRTAAAWVVFGLTAASLVLSLFLAWVPLSYWDGVSDLASPEPGLDRLRQLWLLFVGLSNGGFLLALVTNLVSPARDLTRPARPALTLVAVAGVLVVAATAVLTALGSLGAGPAVACGAVILLLFLAAPLIEVLALVHALRLRREPAAVRR